MLTGAQLRMARAALRMTTEALATLAMCDQGTIVRIESGKRAYRVTLLRLREVLENAGVEFIDPVAGVRGAGVCLKWETENAAKGGDTQGASASQGDTSGLEALAPEEWMITETDDADEPEELFERTNAERAAMLAYWRARPEKWAALACISQECLLRAMEVDRL